MLINKLQKFLRVVIAAIKNYFSHADIIYVIEDAAWVIKKEGENLVSFLSKENVHMRLSITHLGARFKIVHFGSINTYLSSTGPKKVHFSNRVVVTWYHSEEKDKRLELAKKISTFVDVIHTSCHLTEKTLIAKGVLASKIKVIHIPIDLSVFNPHPELKKDIRKKYQIPENKFVIGSFQKDGNGWGEGTTPKLIKGPDIFCDVIEKIKSKISVHILLSGPARGYVKKRLDEMKVSYTHLYFDEPDKICELYYALDLYLLSSRVEGGPKSLLESWATGTPLVATKVGMVIDNARDGINGLFAEVEDVDRLSQSILEFYENCDLKQKTIKQALEDVKKLSYTTAAQRYKEVYSDLIPTM